ncbi:MAG: Type pilus biosis/stability protein PilW [Steroidobacteraceae bacterium]|jgi:type IV pilus assembly protein PilF|nr:Type pilus biosis/stability protein PilW [Steroidobacteraceae bacterium]
MKSLATVVAVSLVALLAGCVSSDGRKELKGESADITASKANIQLGTAYLQQGKFALAKEKLDKALGQNPKDPDVHTSLGLLYDRTGEVKLADKHFREALRLAPDRPDLSNNYAIYLCKNGRVEEGVDKFTSVAANRYYRTPEVALTNAGVCLLGAKKYDEAQKNLAAAIKARPNYSEATVQLAALHLERAQLPEARKVVDTYINAFRPNPDVLFAAVSVARASKDKLAEEKYSRTLRMEFPDSAQARALKRGS